MRRVDRTAVQEPPILSERGDDGKSEAERIAEHYASPDAKTYDWKKRRLYAHDEVKRALRVLFHKKCAYCEWYYAASHSINVEHYRPKSRVAKVDCAAVHRGYHWRAVDWENLLAACIDCNSFRYHDEQADSKAGSGKGDRFPLRDPSKRATCAADEPLEDPLLLDPTRHDPADHLEFTWRGIIRPKDVDGAPSPYGSTSIDIYGLQRTDLVPLRRDHAIRVLGRLRTLRRAKRALDANPGDRDARQGFNQSVRELRDFLRPSAPFSAMALDLTRRAGFDPIAP
jgi:uncharacterized protein (TIGR02646 family)